MEVIQILSSKSTYISSENSYTNKKCSEILKIGKIKEDCNIVRFETLVKFTLDAINSDKLEIKKVYLGLRVVGWETEKEKDEYILKISINEEDFDSSWTNQEMKPKSKWYKNESIDKSQIERGWLSIDLTELVKLWIEGKIPNYGITLWTDEFYLLEISSDCAECCPSLTFYGHVSQNTPCNKETVVLQIQSKNGQNKAIDTNAPVEFDTIFSKSSDSLDYDIDKDKVIVKKPGWYLVEWWIAIDGSGDVPQISFVLQNEDGSISCESSAPVFVLSQPSGNAAINIKDENTTLQLINKSGAAIQFANVGTQASLVINKI